MSNRPTTSWKMIPVMLLMLAAALGAVATVSAAEPPGLGETETVTTTVTVDQTCPPKGLPCAEEAARMTRLAYLRRQHLQRYRRVLLEHGNVREAIALAAVAYGVSEPTLLRKALCETGGTLWPGSRNRTAIGDEHASGLFQFLPSTWRSTPYRGYSIWRPYANALAAGWMHAHGRGGEWACR